MLWEIKPLEKKNVFQRTHFIVEGDGIASGKTFYMEEWYRWGRCIIESNEAPTASSDSYEIPFDLGGHDIHDQESDDGCSLDFTFEESDNWTEEEKQYIYDLWEEDSWSAFEENDIYSNDCDTQYYGPLEIICIDSTPTAEKPKGTWPF